MSINLAQKYRPNGFDSLVGQEFVVQAINRYLAISQARGYLSHQVFLFAGERGTGKTTSARILSKALNCRKGPTPTPCGVCEVCTSPSLDIVEWDAARASSIDSIRDLKQATRISPTFVKYRIYILDEIHMLSPQAFDALLKLLEEPPKHCIFILATTELDQVPETIRSRVQIFKFGLISPEAVESRLRYIAQSEGIQLPEDAYSYISKAGKGSMRDAISILSRLVDFSSTWTLESLLQVLGYPSKDLVETFISLLLKGDPRVVEILAELGGVDLFLFWDEVISTLKSHIESFFGSESIQPVARILQILVDRRIDLAISSNPLATANLILLTFSIP